MTSMTRTAIAALCALSSEVAPADTWPDGTKMDEWFLKDAPVGAGGRVYRLVDYGVYPGDAATRTKEIQAVIDAAAGDGGGTVVVTPGVFKTGALFFRPGVDLRLEKGAVLLGSDDLSDYPLSETRMEGRTCTYFPAVVNADGCDGFTISGDGAVDGNGLRSWKAFWLRRKWKPDCTNMEEQRTRVLYVANSRNVRVDGVSFQNSMYWTTHFYRCDFLKITNCRFYALSEPKEAKGPSTDGIDLDVCSDVVVRDCWISNNDDGVCLKGGKGAFADDYGRFPGNGDNDRILVEGLTASVGTHSALTLGSESVRCRNVVFRNSAVEGCGNLLNLKMRTDTPQTYEHILVENVNGWIKGSFLMCAPWTQFADLEGRPRAEVASRAAHVAMRDCRVKCGTFFRATDDGDIARLEDFSFSRLRISAADRDRHEHLFRGVSFDDVAVDAP